MVSSQSTTKILFVDNDEHSFAIRQCIARALVELPPIELLHASDATEALSILEEYCPDVIVLDGDISEECALLLDSLSGEHPPIVFQTESPKEALSIRDSEITYIKKNESLEGLHKTLLVATSLSGRHSKSDGDRLH